MHKTTTGEKRKALKAEALELAREARATMKAARTLPEARGKARTLEAQAAGLQAEAEALKEAASSEFIEFLKCVDSAYPRDIKIIIILDNVRVHTSKETKSYLKAVPQRFHFVFTPKHASWLNIIESLFSKMTRSMLGVFVCHPKKS